MSRFTPPIGCVGHVTRHGAIRPGRTGEVMIEVDGGLQAYLAHDADGGAIEPLTRIVVVDRIAERTVLVTPVPGASPDVQPSQEELQ